MKFDVLYTSNFKKELKRLAKKHLSLKKDLEGLISILEENPEQGTALGNECYKIRLAIKSKKKGKSGGARVISFVKIILGEVYLLSVYDKSEKEDITAKEIMVLLKEAGISD